MIVFNWWYVSELPDGVILWGVVACTVLVLNYQLDKLETQKRRAHVSFINVDVAEGN